MLKVLNFLNLPFTLSKMSLKSCNVLTQQQSKTEMVSLEKNERRKSRGKIQVNF